MRLHPQIDADETQIGAVFIAQISIVHRRRFAIILSRMPFLSEALRFAENPATSDDQLRRACELLSLDSSGTHDELRARLLAHLNTLDSEAPVVCLNPKVAL